MELTLLSITVWLTHFLIVSSLYFNTSPPSTLRKYTETIQITKATTETQQELGILINTTALSPATTTHASTLTTALASEANVTAAEEITFVHQFNSSIEPQSTIMGVAKRRDGARDINTVLHHTNTSLTATTVPFNFARLTTSQDDKTETGSWSSAYSTSYNNDGHSSLGSVIQTQTADTWDTRSVKQTSSKLFNSVQTVPWRDWMVKGKESMKTDKGNYEMSSTQATFANSNEESERTQSTTGSYSLTTEHRVLFQRDKHYNTTPNATDTTSATPTLGNNWITSQNTDIPMTTTVYTTLNSLNITNTTENYTSTPVLLKSGGRWAEQPRREDSEVNQSTTQQSIYRFTNSTAHTERENRTPSVTPDTPNGTTTNNNSNIADLTDSNINATNIITTTMNKTDTENRLWPECFHTNSEQAQFKQSRLVCFITVWTLAMTASVFLGITIFLWVRLSVLKKRVKLRGRGQAEKGGQKWEKESLWADPKASVQERVECWYINGSTLEADRKERERKREQRTKRIKQEPNKNENELWIQPRVTVNDITEFWYANRRTREERTEIV